MKESDSRRSVSLAIEGRQAMVPRHGHKKAQQKKRKKDKKARRRRRRPRKTRRKRRLNRSERTRERQKEMNLVSNPKVELRGRVKAKILPAVHRKI